MIHEQRMHIKTVRKLSDIFTQEQTLLYSQDCVISFEIW